MKVWYNLSCWLTAELVTPPAVHFEKTISRWHLQPYIGGSTNKAGKYQDLTKQSNLGWSFSSAATNNKRSCKVTECARNLKKAQSTAEGVCCHISNIPGWALFKKLLHSLLIPRVKYMLHYILKIHSQNHIFNPAPPPKSVSGSTIHLTLKISLKRPYKIFLVFSKLFK